MAYYQQRKPAMVHIAPIPTRYRGIQFKSRTEARWAVVFDNLRGWIDSWTYEPYTWNIETPKGTKVYTPDFELSYGENHYLVEVKPKTPTPDYLRFLHDISRATSVPVHVLIGSFYHDEPKLKLSTTGGKLPFSIYNIQEVYQSASHHRFDI